MRPGRSWKSQVNELEFPRFGGRVNSAVDRGGRALRLYPRFVVINRKAKPQRNHERVNCARGDAENRIKELIDLSSGASRPVRPRTSNS